MRYIKSYENYTDTLDMLVEHLVNFLKNTEEPGIFLYTNSAIEYSIWYHFNIVRKCLFRVNKIDYYYGDLDRYFEFNLDKGMKDVSYSSNIIYNYVQFINSIMNKYKTQGMIKMSSAENIINDINNENYEQFITANKYNL